VGQGTGAAAGDDRDGDRGAHGPDQLQVEARGGPVRVYRVQQDLARATLHGLPCPSHRVHPGANPAAMGGHLKTGGHPWGPASVHGQHDALGPEPLRRLFQQFRAGDCRRVERDLVRPGAQQPVHVRDGAHAAADGERDEDLFGGPPHHVDHGVPAAA